MTCATTISTVLEEPLARAAIRQGTFIGLFNLSHWLAWLEEARVVLSDEEKQRIASRRISADRDALTLAYALHRMVLGRALACEPQDVPIGRDQAGCPRLPPSSGVFTSLSHAGHRAVAVAVTRTGPVGVDLEASGNASVMSEIADQVCHPMETVALASLDERAANDAMLAIWVRKEAVLKAAGIGLQREMRTFQAADEAVLALPGSGVTQVRMLNVGQDWKAAVSHAPGSPLTYEWLSPLQR